MSGTERAEQAATELDQALRRAAIKANVGSEGQQIHILTDAQGADDLTKCLRALRGSIALLEEAIADMRIIARADSEIEEGADDEDP